MSALRLFIISGCLFFAGCISVPVENNVSSSEDSGVPHQPIVNVYHNVHYGNPGYFPRGFNCTGGYYSMRGYRN